MLAVVAAAPAHAAEDSLIYPWINFAMLIAVLVYFARKPIQTYFGDRRSAIRKDLDDAAAMKRRAEEHYAQWNRRIVDLDRELAEIRTAAQQRADAERANLIAEARAAAERIRSDAANAVEHELRRARSRLREEASALAVELASGILREKVTAQDRDRLIDEFIERIARPDASFAQRAQVSRSEPQASEGHRAGERRPAGGK
jgi:F-type H+-transporting ATPase subunit b